MLIGCMGVDGSTSTYKAMLTNGEKIKYKKETYGKDFRKIKDLENKKIKNETCIFGLLYMLIPINFWDLRFTDNQHFKQGFQNMKLGSEFIGLKYVSIRRYGFSSPFGWHCTEISGIPITDKGYKELSLEYYE